MTQLIGFIVLILANFFGNMLYDLYIDYTYPYQGDNE